MVGCRSRNAFSFLEIRDELTDILPFGLAPCARDLLTKSFRKPRFGGFAFLSIQLLKKFPGASQTTCLCAEPFFGHTVHHNGVAVKSYWEVISEDYDVSGYVRAC